MRLYGDLRSGNCYKVWLLARAASDLGTGGYPGR